MTDDYCDFCGFPLDDLHDGMACDAYVLGWSQAELREWRRWEEANVRRIETIQVKEGLL